jgi:alkaline phosphatase
MKNPLSPIRRRIRPLVALASSLLATACTSHPPRSSDPGSTDVPQAVILMIGDGMGPSQVTLARDSALGSEGRFAFERLPVLGLVTTWSASNRVTDSGAAATAFSAAVKTDNRVIGVDPAGRKTRTLADLARAAGWRVGYVTTTRITHATPAAFYAHHADRDDECAIAPQLVAAAPDVALGGGLDEFDPGAEECRDSPPRGDLLAAARAAGYSLWLPGQPVPTGGDRLLGLLARSHLAFQLDRERQPAADRAASLADMTRVALERLKAGGRSFFLLVEGGRIDQAAHAFDAAGVVAETRAFDEAVRVVEEHRRSDPRTLVVLTADHATAGLAINEFVDWDLLTRQRASVEWMVKEIRRPGVSVEQAIDRLREWTTIADFRAEEIAAVREPGNDIAGLREARRRLGRSLGERNGVTFVPRAPEGPAATHGHTGEDVALYAGGPGSEAFRGVLDNTDIARRIARSVGWPAPGLEP